MPAQPISMLRGLLLALALLLAGCQSSDVLVDYDTERDFSQLQYYRWQPQSEEPAEPLLAERVTKAVTAALARAALYPATDQHPADVVVRHYVSTQPIAQPAKPSSSIGFGSGGGNSAVGISLQLPIGKKPASREVQIIVDLIDTAQDTLLWRGSKTLPLEDESAEQLSRRINAAVGEIFSFYPPAN